MKKLFLPVFLCWLLVPVSAQQVLNITEMDQAKNEVSKKEDFINKSLVDINSILEIGINKIELRKLVGNKADSGISAKCSKR